MSAGLNSGCAGRMLVVSSIAVVSEACPERSRLHQTRARRSNEMAALGGRARRPAAAPIPASAVLGCKADGPDYIRAATRTRQNPRGSDAHFPGLRPGGGFRPWR